jgi:hypothetical protein
MYKYTAINNMVLNILNSFYNLLIIHKKDYKQSGHEVFLHGRDLSSGYPPETQAFLPYDYELID